MVPGIPTKRPSTSNSTAPTYESRAMVSPCTPGSLSFANSPYTFTSFRYFNNPFTRFDAQPEVDGRYFWSGTTAPDLVDVRVFESVQTPSCFCKVSTVCFFPAKTSLEEITRRCFCCRLMIASSGEMTVTALNPITPFPLGFDCFPYVFSFVFFERLPSDLVSVAPHEIDPTKDDRGFCFVGRVSSSGEQIPTWKLRLSVRNSSVVLCLFA